MDINISMKHFFESIENRHSMTITKPRGGLWASSVKEKRNKEG